MCDTGRHEQQVAFGIEDKVRFLTRPESYASPTTRVETVETHMAWVFLTDEHAFKLKKPVRYDYLDFSTVEARRHDCREEVRLNRRLAPDVYLGVCPLSIDEDGAMHVDGSGEVVDWLVKMRRLPADRMLDCAIEHQSVSQADIHKVGSRLARFYRNERPVELTPPEYRRRLLDEVHNNRRELSAKAFAMSDDVVDSVSRPQERFLAEHVPVLDGRVQAGRVVEAHGDLRPEHICLEETPVVIDCLEFNRDFRLLDAASELAYLAMECERLGAHEVGRGVLDVCCRETGDDPPEPLLRFYMVFHACTRAKVALWHLKDDDVRQPDKWKTKARQYLELAQEIWERI